MLHELRLTCRPESEFDGELCASIESADYRGQAAAWFNADELRAFCASLGAYPIPSAEPPCFKAGNWSKAGKDLVQIGLTIAPHGPRGLLVSVLLSSPIWELDDLDLHRSAEVHFRTDYPSLDRFRTSLSALLASGTGTAILHGG